MHRTLKFTRRETLKWIGISAAFSVLSIAASPVDAADNQKLKIGIIGSGQPFVGRDRLECTARNDEFSCNHAYRGGHI
jgi:hypothetical protein